jgi:xylulokinase
VADVLLGADLGTSGLKVVALRTDGSVVAEAEAGYPVQRPNPGWAQIDVRTWCRALDDALARLGPALSGVRVVALGLSGQMHGAVLVDAEGVAVAPALLWSDQRAVVEVNRWRALPEAERAALANPLVPGMTGPMLAWLARHRPALLAAARSVLLPKDALRAALLPEADPGITDRSDASATLLWDVPADRWSAAALAAAGVSRELLPAVRPPDEVVGAARLPVGEVPVVVGGADTPLALLAAGTRSAVQVNLGTGVQVLRPDRVPTAVAEPPVHCYADVAGGWYGMAALQNGGSAWSWVCEVLGLTWADLFGSLTTSPAGSRGVLFHPFLTGERGGLAGAADRAAWTGLAAGTTRTDLARAAVEGVVFAIRAAIDLLDVPDDGEAVVLTGGGGRSPEVQQLVADVVGRPVRYLRQRSASSIGAAVLAARGLGLEVLPDRNPGPVVEPRSVPQLRAAAEQWRRS